MPSTQDFTLLDLIEDTLSTLYRDDERPLTVVMGSDSLANSADQTLTLNSATDWDAVAVNDRLEYGDEVMLVVDKSADATPVFTVRRAQFNTPNAGTVGVGEVLLLNPLYHRNLIRRRIEAFARGSLSSYLPYRVIQEITRTTNQGWGTLDADTLDVFEVFYITDLSGEKAIFDNWVFDPDMPTSLVSTGKAITHLSLAIPDTQTLYANSQMPYQWYDGATDLALTPNAPVDEADYIRCLWGMEDMIPLYVAAYLVTGRELTRADVDTIEEWNEEQAARQGLNIRIVRELWSHFFRRVDEMKAQHPMPKPRRYRGRKVIGWND